MKRQSSKIREEIARLQDQRRQAETREAERVGRIALRAGIGEIEIEEGELLAAFEEFAARFRDRAEKSSGSRIEKAARTAAASVASSPAAGGNGEA